VEKHCCQPFDEFESFCDGWAWALFKNNESFTDEDVARLAEIKMLDTNELRHIKELYDSYCMEYQLLVKKGFEPPRNEPERQWEQGELW